MATVKEIPPPRKKEPSFKKVAAYCRVSTKTQKQLDSLVAQENYYEDKIKANPDWQFAGIYSDVGSGTTIKGRKRLNALISACRRGKVDMVLIKAASRFARNTVDALKRSVCFAAGTWISTLKKKISTPFMRILNFY